MNQEVITYGGLQELGNAGGSFGKRCLFFVTTILPAWREGTSVAETHCHSRCSMRFRLPLKNRRTDLCAPPHRTHDRDIVSKVGSSGPQTTVGEGSRQNRSVTSGKGLAQRIWTQQSQSEDLSCPEAA